MFRVVDERGILNDGSWHIAFPVWNMVSWVVVNYRATYITIIALFSVMAGRHLEKTYWVWIAVKSLISDAPNPDT